MKLTGFSARWAIVVGVVLAIGSARSVAAATITLGSSADTYLRDATPRGSAVFMDVRGNATTDGFDGYLRFDLSSLGDIVISSASLKLTVSGGASRNDTLVNGRFGLYGLNDVAGNTPQNWDEATFVIGDKGTESVSTLTGLTDLDDNVAGISEVLNPAAGSAAAGTTVTISGAPLVAFLQGRSDASGLATFVLNQEALEDRGYGLASKENLTEEYRPMLELTYEAAVPEPATVSLVGLALAALGLSSSRYRRGTSSHLEL